MSIPQGLRYTEDHEWIKVDSGVARVGITEFAVEQLGDITLVELPPVGSKVEQGKVIGTIESVKAVSDLYSPVSGTVKSINASLEDAPEKVNESPYDAGWMLDIELSAPAELDALFDTDKYKEHLSSLDG